MVELMSKREVEREGCLLHSGYTLGGAFAGAHDPGTHLCATARPIISLHASGEG